MCFTTVVTIVSAKLYELVEVFVPNIKCYCSAAFTFTQLVYCNSRIVVQTNPRNNATRGVFETAECRSSMRELYQGRYQERHRV